MDDTRRLFEKARLMALSAHAAQRYGDKPYEWHLQAVVSVLERFGASLDDRETADLLVAAWLHDSLEDTALTHGEIVEELGAEIAELVRRVTDEPGTSRKVRKPATYAKTRQHPRAITLKLADRIANAEASAENHPGRFQMYAREHAEFVAALKPASEGSLADAMWAHLETLFGDRL